MGGWQAYRGLFDDDYLDARTVEEERVARYEAWLAAPVPGQALLVVEETDGLTGMAMLGSSRDDDLPEAAELYALYVSLDRRSTGVGGALMTAGFARFDAAVQTLWTLEGNVAARRFYERHGFVADGGRKVLELPGRPAEVRYRRARLG